MFCSARMSCCVFVSQFSRGGISAWQPGCITRLETSARCVLEQYLTKDLKPSDLSLFTSLSVLPSIHLFLALSSSAPFEYLCLPLSPSTTLYFLRLYLSFHRSITHWISVSLSFSFSSLSVSFSSCLLLFN